MVISIIVVLLKFAENIKKVYENTKGTWNSHVHLTSCCCIQRLWGIKHACGLYYTMMCNVSVFTSRLHLRLKFTLLTLWLNRQTMEISPLQSSHIKH